MYGFHHDKIKKKQIGEPKMKQRKKLFLLVFVVKVVQKI